MTFPLSKLMTRHFLVSLLISISVFPANAQKCPRNFYDCKGACGWFMDADHDGYCDFTAFSDALIKKILHKKDSITEIQTLKENHISDSIKEAEETVKKADVKVNANKTEKKQTEESITHNCPYENTPECEKNNPASAVQTAQAKTDTTQSIQQKQSTATYQIKKYDIILIFCSCVFLYLLSWLLAKRKIYRKSTHRKIWNTLLLLSFLNTGLTGLFLVIQLNYQILFSWFSKLLFWHVEFGIGMAAISILHILWHWKYFRNMLFKKKDEAGCI